MYTIRDCGETGLRCERPEFLRKGFDKAANHKLSRILRFDFGVTCDKLERIEVLP